MSMNRCGRALEWLYRSSLSMSTTRSFAAASGEGIQYLDTFTNWEQRGVPTGAGADTPDGFDLGRMFRLLKDMGDPQKACPVVHVAGSKGKGSTTTFLASILSAAGYRTGSYTSPHVSSLHERISVDGRPISALGLDQLVAAARPTLEAARQREGGALTHFEVLTALALCHFRDTQVDAAVVEVGLGGTRDATNVFDENSLAIAVITAIDREHQAALGGTLVAVAAAKAGIMKVGRPVVVAPQPHPTALACLREHADALGCQFWQAGAEVRRLGGPRLAEGGVRQDVKIVAEDGEGPSVRGIGLRLVGEHQVSNASTAVAAARILRRDTFPRISREAVASGLQSAFVCGRFQVARMRVTDGSEEPWLVLDGAHTPAAADSLVAALREVFPENPLGLVVGMAEDKDHYGVCAALRASHPVVVIFTSADVAGSSARSASPGTLVAQWQAAGMATKRPVRSREQIKASVMSAVFAAHRELQAKSGSPVICVTGSLHMVAAALNCVPLASA